MSLWNLGTIYLHLTLLSGITACLYSPLGPLECKPGNLVCPLPLDNLSLESIAPWTRPPRCLRPGTSDNLPDKNSEEATYCLYTSSAFQSGHGTSIITTPETASNLLGNDALSERPISPAASQHIPQDAYEIVDIPHKGKGVVATRKIRRGEIFMVDYPAVLIGVPFLEDVPAHHRRRLVKRGLEQLPQGTREGVNRLARKGGNYLLDDIFAVNAVSVPIGEEEAGMGLFVRFSRVNHDCRPNALYRFSPKTLALEVFSYRTILPGEEITVSYASITLAHAQRRQYLQQNFHLDCTCSLCHSATSEDVAESDHLRERVGELRQALAQATGEQYFENALAMAHEWVEMAEKEGIPPLMTEYYDVAGRLSFDVGDLPGARRYAQLALDGWTRFGSADDAELEAAREFMRMVNRLGRDVRLEKKGVANIFSAGRGRD